MFRLIKKIIVSIKNKLPKRTNKKNKAFEFEKVLDNFERFKNDYCITYKQEDAITSVIIESKIKPSTPKKTQKKED